jgi:conjugal transfer pilus assembly protein TraK
MELSGMNRPRPPSGPRHLEVHLGETLALGIAVGQVNRIVLPFEKPEIRTLNPATAEIQGHVLYIAPTDNQRIHLFVSDGAEGDASLALSLQPEEMSPREVILDLIDESTPPTQRSHSAAGTLTDEGGNEKTRAGSSDLASLLKTLALGQIPPGFRYRNPLGPESIHCQQKGAAIQTRQVFEGGTSRVIVGVLRNGGKTPLNLDEATCLRMPDITAIAHFPEGPLGPGQASEIYVVVEPERKQPARARPRLLSASP